MIVPKDAVIYSYLGNSYRSPDWEPCHDKALCHCRMSTDIDGELNLAIHESSQQNEGPPLCVPLIIERIEKKETRTQVHANIACVAKKLQISQEEVMQLAKTGQLAEAINKKALFMYHSLRLNQSEDIIQTLYATGQLQSFIDRRISIHAKQLRTLESTIRVLYERNVLDKEIARYITIVAGKLGATENTLRIQYQERTLQEYISAQLERTAVQLCTSRTEVERIYKKYDLKTCQRERFFRIAYILYTNPGFIEKAFTENKLEKCIHAYLDLHALRLQRTHEWVETRYRNGTLRDSITDFLAMHSRLLNISQGQALSLYENNLLQQKLNQAIQQAPEIAVLAETLSSLSTKNELGAFLRLTDNNENLKNYTIYKKIITVAAQLQISQEAVLQLLKNTNNKDEILREQKLLQEKIFQTFSQFPVHKLQPDYLIRIICQFCAVRLTTCTINSYLEYAKKILDKFVETSPPINPSILPAIQIQALLLAVKALEERIVWNSHFDLPCPVKIVCDMERLFLQVIDYRLPIT